ncbi:lipopolysaccharide biosynthesis protein [Eubacterium sp. An11]|uniref:lipopolysaccharide biosynthesis protein n=1 Tax=Eubacterium sp. An11 TaxID=1965542 RepID=UPI001122871A|nr:lipopolysaccharide biosynthesis protein [Eubacterium sp. An11]
MNKENIITKSISWSFISEVAVKFVSPISNMILARILSPDAFGVIAICNMLISFIDLITDAGFGKFLIQHDFIDEEEKEQYANVSFWTNLLISCIITVFIIFFRSLVAKLLGNPEYGDVIAVASIQLIITSVSSVQLALFRRNFEFSKLFIVRIAVAFVPLFITVPLAIFFKSYWALVIGNLSGAAINAVLLTIFSRWRPQIFYKISILANMFNYSFWSLCEALANWCIFWMDTFIVGRFFGEYELGLYKNSTNMVQSLMGMVSSAVSPVLLSTLSRLKKINKDYMKSFFIIQNFVLCLILPMGIGLFLYRRTATILLFGKQWIEAANIIGEWGVMMMLSVIFYSLPAELYKSIGLPKYLFLSQIIYLMCMVPMCYIGALHGFWTMVFCRCFSIVFQIVISIVFLKIYFKINLRKYFYTFLYPCIATLCMTIFSVIFNSWLNGILEDILGIALSIIIYLAVLLTVAKKQIKENYQFIKTRKM